MMQQLISEATEFLREEWDKSIQAYSQFISLCQEQISKNTHQNPNHLSNLNKSLCLALSNRAEARSHLRNLTEALADCEKALEIESAHFKTLLCKGKILLSLNRYGMALDCFKLALMDPQSGSNSESIKGYLERCKKLEFSSRTGAFDLSDWVLNGFRGKHPEIAEYIGAVEIKKSQMGHGRGLFATKNVDCGTLLLVTKAIAAERGIMPSSKDEDLGRNTQLVMWKSLIGEVVESSRRSHRTHRLIRQLSTGEEEDTLEVTDVSLFRPEAEESGFFNENLDMGRILKILDVNSCVEDAVSSKVLGINSCYHGVGLWILPSFINHACNPNARRLHVGDYMMVHASRDIKAGEEITLAYYDVLSPLSNRRERAKTWGFDCCCKRCKFEEGIMGKQEMREIEMGIDRGMEAGGMVYRLEEGMRRLNARGKEKGYLRSSFWEVYSETFESEKSMRRWGRRIPAMEAVVDSVAEAVGSDERVLKVVKEGLKRKCGGGGGGMLEMERAMKLGRGVYGKVMKKQAMRTLLELCVQE